MGVEGDSSLVHLSFVIFVLSINQHFWIDGCWSIHIFCLPLSYFTWQCFLLSMIRGPNPEFPVIFIVSPNTVLSGWMSPSRRASVMVRRNSSKQRDFWYSTTWFTFVTSNSCFNYHLNSGVVSRIFSGSHSPYYELPRSRTRDPACDDQIPRTESLSWRRSGNW